MLFRRIYQFMIVYAVFLGILLVVKKGLSLSDYVIPGLPLILETAVHMSAGFFTDVMDTLSVAILGQAVSIFLAFFVGILGRKSSWAGSMIRVTAYNIQAYPIVALAPIIFILLGDGFLSRLLIAAMICYFPLLLSVLGVMAAPVEDMEHFYIATGRMRWQLEVKIRHCRQCHPGHGRHHCGGIHCRQCRHRIQYPHRPVSERSGCDSHGSVHDRHCHFRLPGDPGNPGRNGQSQMGL